MGGTGPAWCTWYCSGYTGWALFGGNQHAVSEINDAVPEINDVVTIISDAVTIISDAEVY